MRMRLAATVLLLFGFSLLAAPLRAEDKPPRLSRSATPAPGEKKLPWLAFEAATQQAKKEGKHIIVDV